MKPQHIDTRHPLVKKLKNLYKSLFRHQSSATATNLTYLSLAFLVFNACTSIYFSHKHLLRDLTDKCLNSFYYTMNESKIGCDDWMKTLVTMAVAMIPQHLSDYPILFVFDDSLIEKEGDSFEAKRHLFDHTAKNGSNYLDGHCFVTLLIMVPVLLGGKVEYISVPVAHRMWTGEQTKLEIAAELVMKAYTYADRPAQYIVLCDSWYPKGVVCDLNKIPNISLICNVRVDTTIFSLPEKNVDEAPKRGRPPLVGDKIDIATVPVVEVDGCDYNVGYVWVKTRLFGLKESVLAIVTEAKESKTRRLFLCTNPSVCECFDASCFSDKKAVAFAMVDRMFIPLAIYCFRWAVEKLYFELKTFWNFREYKLRSKVGIERLVNLQMLTYALLSMLPHLDEDFRALTEMSMQERRYMLGRLIDRQLFFDAFVATIENGENSDLLKRAYKLNSLGGSAA